MVGENFLLIWLSSTRLSIHVGHDEKLSVGEGEGNKEDPVTGTERVKEEEEGTTRLGWERL